MTNLEELFDNYCELAYGFSSTNPTPTVPEFGAYVIEAEVRERFGDTEAFLGAAQLACAGEGEYEDLAMTALKRIKQNLGDVEYPIRDQAIEIRWAYIFSDGTMRAKCEQAQAMFGGSIADWEDFTLVPVAKFDRQVERVVKSLAEFETIIASNRTKATK